MARRLTTEIFIERAKAKHGNKYDYSKSSYDYYNTKICIICPRHGSFWQTPHDHLDGHGCPKCGIELIGDLKRKTQSEFISESSNIHLNKYDYSRVNYVNNITKVCIICSKHGEFWQKPYVHLGGHGCPQCGNDLKNADRVLSVGEFIDKAVSVHGDNYDYSKVKYISTHQPVEIVCPEHGSFWQAPSNHLMGQNCPRCACQDSSYEEYLYGELLLRYDEDDIKREYNKDSRYPFHVDFYIKSRDLFIEINGFWTHGGHWFDENNETDVNQLKYWKNQCSQFYDSAIETWVVSDVKKREHARKNNLNYVVLWTMEDIEQWINEGLPIRKDWQ